MPNVAYNATNQVLNTGYTTYQPSVYVPPTTTSTYVNNPVVNYNTGCYVEGQQQGYTGVIRGTTIVGGGRVGGTYTTGGQTYPGQTTYSTTMGIVNSGYPNTAGSSLGGTINSGGQTFTTAGQCYTTGGQNTYTTTSGTGNSGYTNTAGSTVGSTNYDNIQDLLNLTVNWALQGGHRA